MEVTSYFVLVFVAFAALGAAEEDDEFAECLQHEVCVEEGGHDNCLQCMGMLSESDTEFCLNSFQAYFADEGMTSQGIVETCCANLEKGRAAVNNYLDERKKHEEEQGISPEDNKKLVETRNCFMAMVENCKFKKSMGMLKK